MRIKLGDEVTHKGFTGTAVFVWNNDEDTLVGIRSNGKIRIVSVEEVEGERRCRER